MLKNLLKHKLVHHDSSKCKYMECLRSSIYWISYDSIHFTGLLFSLQMMVSGSHILGMISLLLKLLSIVVCLTL